MSTPFRFAIIGLGGIAQKWADDVQKHLPQAQVYAVCSRTQAHADAFAQTYGAAHACGSIDALLAIKGIDAVYISNPHPDHFATARACLEAGLPVICEKPMAMHHTEVASLVALAHERKVFLMEAIWSRFIPGFDRALQLVAEGLLGDLVSITADFGFRADPKGKPRIWKKELGAGSLLDIGIYPVLLTQYLLGQPDGILASATLTAGGIDADCAMIFNWKTGAQALLHSSILATTPTEAHIYGTQGSLYLHPRFHHTQLLTHTDLAGTTTNYPLPYTGHGYHYEAAAAIQAIRSGAIEHPLVSHDFSLQLAQTLGRVMDQIGLDYGHDAVV